MLGRMLGAARLSSDTYEDVERDGGATIQALLVVVIVAIASGVGGILSGESTILGGLLFGVIRGIVFWAVWALLVLLIGTTILKSESTEADWGQLARGTGFAQTPGILGILVFIPMVGPIIAFLSFIWQVAAHGGRCQADSGLHIYMACILRHNYRRCHSSYHNVILRRLPLVADHIDSGYRLVSPQRLAPSDY